VSPALTVTVPRSSSISISRGSTGHRDHVPGDAGHRTERVAGTQCPDARAAGHQACQRRDRNGAVHPPRAERDVACPVRHAAHLDSGPRSLTSPAIRSVCAAVMPLAVKSNEVRSMGSQRLTVGFTSMIT